MDLLKSQTSLLGQRFQFLVDVSKAERGVVFAERFVKCNIALGINDAVENISSVRKKTAGRGKVFARAFKKT